MYILYIIFYSIKQKENLIEYNNNERKSEKKHKFEEFLARQETFQHMTERKKQKLHEIYEKKETPIKPKILPSPYANRMYFFIYYY